MRATDRLAALLRGALVQILTGDRVGSGVLIAPGFALTCAHVVPPAGSRVTLRWNDAVHAGTVRAGTVRYASPRTPAGAWLYPDLAVVEVDEPPDGHPCAWLDQRWPSVGDQLLVLGYSDTYRAGAVPSPALVTYDGTRRHGEGEMLQLAGREISAGMSGGPVLNTVTGGVCGVVKATRLANAPMGGLATPARALRQMEPDLYRRIVRTHDRHHASGTTWTAVLDTLDPASDGEVGASEERRLRGLLAGMPVPTDLPGRLLRVLGPLYQPAPDEPILDHGDAVTELGEQVPPREGLPYVLAYATDLATHGGAAGVGLRDWVMETAGRLRLGPAVTARLGGGSTPAPVTSVMVRMRPAGNDPHRYRLTIWRYGGPGLVVPALDDSVAVPLAEAWSRLREWLPGQIALLSSQGARVEVELFLPRHLMDTDIDQWRLWPDEHWSTLGRRYAVVVRDVARLEDNRVRYPWERRWDKLAGQGVGRSLELIPCADRRGHEELEGWIEPEEGRSAFVFASSPVSPAARPAFEVGLPAGVPVMIWRRSGCGGCEGPDGVCTADRFHSALRDALGNTPIAQLPDRVRGLRNEATGPGSGGHCGHGIVLLCDDPRRRPPLDRMVLPEERHENV